MGEIVILDALFDKEAVDGGGRTEGSHLVFFNDAQQIGGDELIIIIDEDAGAHEPLAIELSLIHI